jgi:uncharacterized protein (DUF2062 family)
MSTWLRKKLQDPLLALLKQGLSPSKLALCVALGAWIGIFPALGVTTGLCALAAFAFGLNMVAIQTVNFSAYPLQFVMLFPFFRAGEWLFKSPSLNLTPAEFVSLVTKDPLGAVIRFWAVTWRGAVVWLLAGLVVVPLAWAILTPVFSKALRTDESKTA